MNQSASVLESRSARKSKMNLWRNYKKREHNNILMTGETENDETTYIILDNP